MYTFSLIVCTYKRSEALMKLLKSVEVQSLFPNEILIIDGSPDDKTKQMIQTHEFANVYYYQVEEHQRGLTKQRNYGISKVSADSEIVCFLDDDLVLEPRYFEEIISTYKNFPDAIGVGGIDLKDNMYVKKEANKKYNRFTYFEIDGWVKKEPLRYKVRKILGLMTDLQPDIIPDFSHGRSGLPPNGKIYKVEHFIGMSMSFKKDLFLKVKFSPYFEGYGLYEDFDFCVRVLNFGKLYVNTNAHVWHYHDESGRPNKYQYGKMVVRNGWYVWRLKFPNPSAMAKLKWHLITGLLIFLRFLNTFTTHKRKEALTESAGRLVAYIQLLYNKPHIQR